ncbi:MAG TPA: hypothetical protein ENG87_05580 [Candidatus Pacearchaeota archaeon]|nr:hypothetical protein [Candidatus Pacearchaeota archaeon]HDZ60197.1 hypothetical protein [Candidatus Pacearchaeota archaeon]
MTSPIPLSIYNPTCSYCWEKSDKAEFILIGKEFHWVCSKKCKKGILEGEYFKEDIKYYQKLLNKLTKMYIEIYDESDQGFFAKLVNKLGK